MTEKTTLARPYALAAFKLAQEKDKLSVWSEMLDVLAAVIADPVMQAIVANPGVRRDALVELLLSICGGRLSDEGQNFVRVLAQAGRLALATEIAALYEQQRETVENRATAHVTAAFEVNPKFRLMIAKAMKKHLGREIDVEVSIDPSLIGGVVIRAGDLVIDASIRGRLNELATQIN